MSGEINIRICHEAFIMILEMYGIGLEAHRRYALYIKLIKNGSSSNEALNRALCTNIDDLPEVMFEKDGSDEF